MLSAYELQRLKNVERNEAVLESLGLGSDNSLKKKKSVRSVTKPVQADSRRRSSRVSGSEPVTTALTDAYFAEEERRAARPGRKRHAPPNYQDKQAEEYRLNKERVAKRRQENAAAAPAPAQRVAQASRQENARRVTLCVPPFLPSMEDDLCVEPPKWMYHTDGANKVWHDSRARAA